MRRDGRVVRRVRTIGSTAYLTWSPDGNRFVYVAERCQDPAGHEDPSCGTLWFFHVDGRGRRRASGEQAVALVWPLLGPSARIEAVPDWSPDGRRLLYTYGCALVTSAPDGSDRRIVRGARDTLLAAWSQGRLADRVPPA
jgi:Tol biopolymer transport system component